MPLAPDTGRGALVRRLFLVWVALGLVATLASLELLASQQIRGDDALRLVEVRDLVAGQGWYDLHHYRINPPEGVITHWSRLVDVPIALVLLILTPLLGAHGAEVAAMVAVPLLTLGVVVGFTGWTTARLFDLRAAGFAALAIGILVPVLFQLQPTRLDHHGWQLAAVAAAVAGLVFRSGRTGALFSGAAMALGANISLEVLPMAAGFALVFALRWLADDRQRGQIAAYLQAFAFGLAVLFMATLGPANLTQYCDAIGPAHLAFFALVAMLVSLGTKRASLAPIGIAIVLGGAGLAGLAVFGALAPQCLASPFSQLDPVVQQYWYDLVPEGMPIWRQSANEAVPAMVQLALALGATLTIIRRSGGEVRRFWLHYLALLCFAVLLGLATARSIAFAGVIAAVPLGWFVGHALERLTAMRPVSKRAAATVILGLALMPSSMFLLADTVRPVSAAAAEKSRSTGVFETSCFDRDKVDRLGTLPAGEIFMPFDLGPTVLMRTHHSVTATGHHRANRAMADVINAFRGSPQSAHRIVAEHGASYVLLCTEMADTKLYAESAPGGLAALLLRGDEPAWLVPVPGFEKGSSRLWRVVD